MKSVQSQLWKWSSVELPRIRNAGRFELSDRDFQTRYLAVTHALHLYDYHAKMRLGKRELELRPGDVTISPAGAASWYDLPRPGHHWCVHFFPGESNKSQISLPVHIRLAGSAAYARQRMAEISRRHILSHRPGDLPAAAMSAELLSLLLWLAERCGDDRPSRFDTAGSKGLDRAVEYVESNLRRSIDAKKLAAVAGVSPGHLSRLFARRFNSSVPEFINRRRIEQARVLLHATQLPVKNIGIEVGLADPHYFNRMFRRFAGHSPTAERNIRER